jgi:hypothetical protein
MARVTGIGGVFLKARDPKALAAWYAQHLGIQLADYGGATLLWSDEIPAGTGQTAWMLFPDTSKHFGDPAQRAMINYRVDDLEALLTHFAPLTSPSTPSRNPRRTATSPGSPTPRATASNSGNLSSIHRKKG